MAPMLAVSSRRHAGRAERPDGRRSRRCTRGAAFLADRRPLLRGAGGVGEFPRPLQADSNRRPSGPLPNSLPRTVPWTAGFEAALDRGPVALPPSGFHMVERPYARYALCDGRSPRGDRLAWARRAVRRNRSVDAQGMARPLLVERRPEGRRMRRRHAARRLLQRSLAAPPVISCFGTKQKKPRSGNLPGRLAASGRFPIDPPGQRSSEGSAHGLLARELARRSTGVGMHRWRARGKPVRVRRCRISLRAISWGGGSYAPRRRCQSSSRLKLVCRDTCGFTLRAVRRASRREARCCRCPLREAPIKSFPSAPHGRGAMRHGVPCFMALPNSMAQAIELESKSETALCS